MFEKLMGTLMAKGARMAAAKGMLCCPACGARKGDVPGPAPELLHCNVCGYDGSTGEWLASKAAGGEGLKVNPDVPPPGTKIVRRKAPGGTVEWEIPASGKGGGLLFFAALWNGFLVLFTGAFVMGLSRTAGNVHADHGEKPQVWFLVLFFGLFWSVGIGMLYAGLRSKYARHRISVGAGEVKLTRELFGRAKTKALVWKDVTQVERKEFYQQNYQPVYGIEIKGKGGKLRFGSMLSEAEKAWLVADLRRVVFGEPLANPVAPRNVEPVAPLAMRPGGRFSITVPKSSGLAGAVVFCLVSGIFLGVGLFVMPHPSRGLPSGGHGKGFDFFDILEGAFHVLDYGFTGIWLLISSVLSLAALASLVAAIRNCGVETKIEGDEMRIAVRRYKGGGMISEVAVPRGQFKDVRTYHSGSSNGKPRKAVELLMGDHVEKLSRWMDAGQADALVAEIRRCAYGDGEAAGLS